MLYITFQNLLSFNFKAFARGFSLVAYVWGEWGEYMHHDLVGNVRTCIIRKKNTSDKVNEFIYLFGSLDIFHEAIEVSHWINTTDFSFLYECPDMKNILFCLYMDINFNDMELVLKPVQVQKTVTLISHCTRGIS